MRDLLARLGDQAAEANQERQAATAAAAAREQTRRQEEEVKGAIRTVTTCDGTVPTEVREWIRAIEIIHAREPAIVITVVTRSSKGRLLETVEGHIATQAGLAVPIARATVPWPALQDAVRLALLGPGDADAVRQELASVSQAAHEDVAAYSLRFITTARDAYPPPRGGDMERIVVKYYTKGLISPSVREILVVHRRPADLVAAITTAKEVSAAQAEMTSLSGGQPVAAVTNTSPTTKADVTPNAAAEPKPEMLAIAALEKRFDKMMTWQGERRAGVKKPTSTGECFTSPATVARRRERSIHRREVNRHQRRDARDRRRVLTVAPRATLRATAAEVVVVNRKRHVNNNNNNNHVALRRGGMTGVRHTRTRDYSRWLQPTMTRETIMGARHGSKPAPHQDNSWD